MNMIDVCLLVAIVVLVVVIVVMSCVNRSNFKELDLSNYQNALPSLPVERRYHRCVDTECQDAEDRPQCLEKCRLKAYRHGMMAKDHCDYVCYEYEGDEDAYYKCLGHCYTDNRQRL